MRNISTLGLLIAVDDETKGAAPRLQFLPTVSHSSDEEDTAPASSKTYKHTRFNPPTVGQPASRARYVDAPPSPKKPSTAEQHAEPVWNDEAPLAEINVENYPFLDPAYIHHLDDTDISPGIRRRTQSVRITL